MNALNSTYAYISNFRALAGVLGKFETARTHELGIRSKHMHVGMNCTPQLCDVRCLWKCSRFLRGDDGNGTFVHLPGIYLSIDMT